MSIIEIICILRNNKHIRCTLRTIKISRLEICHIKNRTVKSFIYRITVWNTIISFNQLESIIALITYYFSFKSKTIFYVSNLTCICLQIITLFALITNLLCRINSIIILFTIGNILSDTNSTYKYITLVTNLTISCINSLSTMLKISNHCGTLSCWFNNNIIRITSFTSQYVVFNCVIFTIL